MEQPHKKLFKNPCQTCTPRFGIFIKNWCLRQELLPCQKEQCADVKPEYTRVHYANLRVYYATEDFVNYKEEI